MIVIYIGPGYKAVKLCSEQEKDHAKRKSRKIKRIKR